MKGSACKAVRNMGPKVKSSRRVRSQGQHYLDKNQ